MQKDKENMLQELNDEELSQVAGGISDEDRAVDRLVKKLLSLGWEEAWMDSPATLERLYRQACRYEPADISDRAIEIVMQRLGF